MTLKYIAACGFRLVLHNEWKRSKKKYDFSGIRDIVDLVILLD